MVQLPTLWGRHKDFTEFDENFEKSYLLKGLSNIVKFFTVWFLKIFCIKWIHIFFWVQCSFKSSRVVHNLYVQYCFYLLFLYRVARKNGTVDTVDFSGLCSDQQFCFSTLLDRASFPHYNNTKIIKFGWELFILWVIYYGLSLSGFARFPEFRGTINDKWMANPENDRP